MTHSVRSRPTPRTSERAAEADRKAQHLHAAQARDQVVAELVDHDQHAERDDERDDGVKRSRHASYLCRANRGPSRVVAKRSRVERDALERLRRAIASASRISCSVPAGAAAMPSSVSAITARDAR